LVVGTVAWAAAGKSKENRIKRVGFMGLTIIRRQLAIYFCLHTGQFESKQRKLASLFHPGLLDTPLSDSKERVFSNAPSERPDCVRGYAVGQSDVLSAHSTHFGGKKLLVDKEQISLVKLPSFRVKNAR
jgi:hypothetical protein